MQIIQTFDLVTAASASARGDFLALLSRGSLTVLRLSDWRYIRALPTKIEKGIIRWTKSVSADAGDRVLLQSGDDVFVWDVNDAGWSAHISNASRESGKIVRADFGDGNDEVITTSDFAAKVTVWSLSSGCNVEVRDPKFVAEPYAVHPHNGFLAVLARPAAQDMLSLLRNGSREVLRTVELRTTDAKGLKWSPDGQWLAVWESTSQGCVVELLTADATPFRLLIVDDQAKTTDDPKKAMLGVASLAWSPTSEALAVAGLQLDVHIYGARTFSRLMTLSHSCHIQDNETCGTVWQEVLLADTNNHVYRQAPLPVVMSTSSSAHIDPLIPGLSQLCFNATGSLLASYLDTTSCTIWIWDIKGRCWCAIFITLAPLRQMLWHPARSDLLLISSGDDRRTTLCVWQKGFDDPVPLDSRISQLPSGRLDVQWVPVRGSDVLLRISSSTVSVLVDLVEHVSHSHGKLSRIQV